MCGVRLARVTGGRRQRADMGRCERGGGVRRTCEQHCPGCVRDVLEQQC